MSISFKKAEASDIPTLISLEKTVSGSKLYSALLTESEWVEAFKRNITYFILEEGAIIGEISCEMKNSEHAYIDGLVITPEHQGKGYARKAMELLLQDLKIVPRIDLVTHPENVKAISLYESLGFAVESRHENYFGDGQPRLLLALVRK